MFFLFVRAFPGTRASALNDCWEVALPHLRGTAWAFLGLTFLTAPAGCSEPGVLKCNDFSLSGGIAGCDTGAADDPDDPDDPDDDTGVITDCDFYNAQYGAVPLDANGDAYPFFPFNYAWQDTPIEEQFRLNFSTDFDYVYADGEGTDPANSTDVAGAWTQAIEAWLTGGSPSPYFTIVQVEDNDATSRTAVDSVNWVFMYDNPVADTGVRANEFAKTECLAAGCFAVECDLELRKYVELDNGDHVAIQWVTSDSSSPGHMNMAKIFAHEWGHVLGLDDHRDDVEFPGSIIEPIDMDYYHDVGYGWPGISEDDYAAAVWIYGPSP